MFTSIRFNSENMLRIGLILVAVTILGCQCDQAEVIKADEKFTSNIYRELVKTKDGSLAFSGIASDLLLSLLANGAKGDTKHELLFGTNLVKDDQARNSGFKQLIPALSIKDNNLQLITANKLYLAEGLSLLEPFKNIAENNYRSEIENLNYENKDQAANTINKWAEQQSKNKIKNLIEANQIKDNSGLVLVSRLHFSGMWAQPYQVTNKGLFTTKSGTTKEVDYLQNTIESKYRRCGFYQAKFLELDLQGGNLSMTFILPDNIDGLKKMDDDLEGVVEPHDMKQGVVAISIPKFKAESSLDLVPALKKLGVDKLFSNEADLSGILSQKNIKVDSILQETVIDIKESGVDAASAANVRVIRQAPAETPFSFDANRPFLYYIREKSSGALILVGKYQG